MYVEAVVYFFILPELKTMGEQGPLISILHSFKFVWYFFLIFEITEYVANESNLNF